MPLRIDRRTLFAASAALLLGVATAGPARAADAGAEAFVKSFVSQMAAVVNGSQDDAAKKQATRALVDSNVDVATVARFCLGRYWRTATPDQQQKYVAVFHQVMLKSINSHLGEYRGFTFEMNGSRAQADNTVVNTTIDRPNTPPANVNWIVSTASGSPKVIDLVAEGASMRLQQRDDYASYLSQHANSIDALIAALERQMNAG